jgi:autotransporter-associated beta strand protein
VASLADHGGAGGTVTNSHGTPAVLTVDAAAGSTTFTGTIADGTGGVSLVKSGDSTQVLAGPGVSTYTGGTIINGGVLEVRRGAGSASRGGLGAGPVVINAGTLRLNSDDYNALGAGTGLVPVTIEAGGTLTADNSDKNAHNLGLLTLNGGTLTSNNGPAGPANDNGLGNFILRDGLVVGGSSMSTISATTLAVYGAFNVADATSGVDLDVSSRIILATPLLKTGEGTMQLTGSNTYTGGTTVAAGTLTLSGGGRLGGGRYNAPITIGENAVLNFNMANSQNLGGDITGKGTLAQNSTASYLYMTGDHSGFEGTFHNVAGNMYLASTAANSPASAKVQVDGGALQIAFNEATGGTWTIGALSGAGGAVQPNNNLVGRTITIEVGGLDSDTTYGGILRNNTNAAPSVLALTKVGSGTLTLSGANNTYSGGTTVEAGILQVAATRALGAGPIRIDGGTVRLATDAYNAFGTPEPAIVIESGGVLTADNTTNNAHNLGALTLNGGMLSSNTVENVHGNFILNAGVTTGGASMSTINATAVSLRNTGGIFNVANVNGGTDLLVLSRVINHPGLAGALTKTGAGTLELAGANTYTGGTVVNAGTLLVSNTAGSGTGSGAVSVNSGATLGGTGRIGSHVNVNSSGSLAPGTSVGTLYLDGGNLTFDQNAFFDVDIDTFGLADLVQMDGGLLSPNEATIRVNLGFSPELGDSWTILQGEGSRDSDFNTQVLVPSGGELLGWMWFDVSYGNSVILTVVPEPGTGLLLLAAAAFGMMVRRRS